MGTLCSLLEGLMDRTLCWALGSSELGLESGVSNIAELEGVQDIPALSKHCSCVLGSGRAISQVPASFSLRGG